jgi:broad specificity phosphatase PhoE
LTFSPFSGATAGAMKSETTIHLIRHGEVYNPRGILYGRLPRFPLSADGLGQACSTGSFLRRYQLGALFSSPLLRARQTAREISRRNGNLSVQISTLLNEVCSPYEGLPGADVDARQGDIYTGAEACFEQPADIVRRVQKFITRIIKRHAGRHVAGVTHGDVILFAVLWASGWAATPQNKTNLIAAGFPVAYPAHASITSLTFSSRDHAVLPRISYTDGS